MPRGTTASLTGHRTPAEEPRLEFRPRTRNCCSYKTRCQETHGSNVHGKHIHSQDRKKRVIVTPRPIPAAALTLVSIRGDFPIVMVGRRWTVDN